VIVEWRRVARGAALAMLAGCGSAEEMATPTPPPAPAVLILPSNARDSTATLDSLTAFIGRVDADTMRMDRVRDAVDLGAGASGTLTAWRADSTWQRIHLAAGGTGFTSSDIYWLYDGALVAARLEISRPDQPPAVETIWFRSGRLYRWTDAAGRRLSAESRSTKVEVEMLLARVNRMLSALPPWTPPAPEPRS
jgi:hypothetical protein